MRVSLNWIQDYLQFELPPTDELVQKIGAQLGAVEEVIDLGAQYQKIIVARIVSCAPVEGSDHLNQCMIDDGGVAQNVERDERGLVQVVCGAPNAREGILVAWLPPGCTVPSTYGKDPFVLEARKLRGVVSNGMLASSKELAIGENHEGILEVDADCQPGADFAEVYKLNDYIIDIENKMFTHRPDCFGQLGVAREIAGILGHQFVSPDWYTNPVNDFSSGDQQLKLQVKNELPDLVPRFMAVAIANVTIGPSPVWLQTYLMRVGIRPINNVVDVTNYIMMLTGQPLHAYDYDKVLELDGGDVATLVARNPRDSERLTLLNGKTIDPRQEAIMIATETTVIGLGGVMGGAETEVGESTKNIILECATFDMYSIRRSSMAHGLFSDAVSRFNKGQSPLQNPAIILQAARTLLKGDAVLASELYDVNFVPETSVNRGSLHPAITIESSYINNRLGLTLTAEQIAALLTNVECSVRAQDDSLEVTAPFWRTDIEIREDVVEEVGRLYGFEKLPLNLPERPITPAKPNDLLVMQTKLRQQLSRYGANEALTYSFVHGKLLNAVGQDTQQAFKLANALSPELQYYRISLMPSLLEKVHGNIKTGHDEFALFEIGKGHILIHKDDGPDGLPQEFEMLALVYAANDKLKKTGAAYYQAARFLRSLAASNGIELQFEIISETPQVPIAKPYAVGRSALVSDKASGTFLGIVGEFNASVRKALKLPKSSAGFEIDVEALASIASADHSYTTISKFPAIEQDICLRVPAELAYADLFELVTETLHAAKPGHSTLGITTVDIYKPSDQLDHKQITFGIRLTSYERTLTDKELSLIMQQLASVAQERLGATVV